LKIRKEHEALQDGSLELIDGLPDEVLGYRRKSGDEEIGMLFNFGDSAKKLQFRSDNCIFKLSEQDEWKIEEIILSGYSGIILKT
jgi:glycosidase